MSQIIRIEFPRCEDVKRGRLSDETAARVLGIHIADATPIHRESPLLSFVLLCALMAVLLAAFLMMGM